MKKRYDMVKRRQASQQAESRKVEGIEEANAVRPAEGNIDSLERLVHVASVHDFLKQSPAVRRFTFIPCTYIIFTGTSV